MKERETIKRFNAGEPISASEFNRGSLDFFSDVVYPLVLKEQAGRQPDFTGEVWYTRAKPLHGKNPEEHLCRPIQDVMPVRIRIIK